MATYFRPRDAFELVSRDVLFDHLPYGVVTVLDVRPEDELANGHLPVEHPALTIGTASGRIAARQEVVAYCRGPWCVLSFEAVALLRQRGYRARRLEDGFPEWKAAGLHASQSSAP